MSQPPDSPRFAPRILVQFDRADRRYRPLDPIAVRYQVEGVADDRVRAIEQSVLWYTEGKGDEDLGVLSFDRIGFATGAHRSRRSDDDTTRTPSPTDVADAASPLATGSLTVRLPVSPLSYEGLAVKISWCVRVRVFFSRPPRVPARDGSSVRVSPPRDFVSEHVFLVGQLPPAECLSETRTA